MTLWSEHLRNYFEKRDGIYTCRVYRRLGYMNFIADIRIRYKSDDRYR